jgi:CheY-like chemotaxis protein
MNEGRPLNNGEKHNGLPLVRRPSSAVERAAPGAKRILSGMVADTLMLAKREHATKPVVSVAMCGWADTWLPEMTELMLRQGLATQSRVEFKSFFWTTEFIEAARHSRFDLFILLLNPGSYSSKDTAEHALGRELNWDDHGDEINAYELIARLKQEFNKPVFAISNGIQYKSKAELEKAGADAVFWMPFSPDEFHSAVNRCLKVPGVQTVVEVAQPRKSRPLRIVMVNDEPGVLQIFEILIRDWFKDATMLFFDNGATALEELAQTDPDLLITDDRMAVMSGGELCQHLLDRKVTYPIIAVSCVGLSEQWVREFANRGLNVSLLDGPPFDFESFLKAVETALNIKRVAIEKPNKLTSQAERRYNEFKSGLPETRTHNEDAETIFKRGLNYSRGEGVPQDYAEAAKWFRKAAEMGFARAQSVLGVCYGNGVGVLKDEIESFKWCQKAAEQGYAEAQSNLGMRSNTF